MPSHDLRTAGAFNPVATAGTTEVWPFTLTDLATGDAVTITSLSVWLGGTSTDADDTTGATEYAGVPSTNTASVTVPIPAAGESKVCRVFINGALKLIGTLTPSTSGTASAVDGVAVAVDDVSIEVQTGATYVISDVSQEDLTTEAAARVAGDAGSVSTAASDATTKASAAQSAAISAAASDATTKANAAQSAATSAAATALATHAADLTLHSSGREMGYASTTAQQTNATTSQTNFTGLEITFTVVSRPVLVEGYLSWVTGSAASTCGLALRDGSDTNLYFAAIPLAATTTIGSGIVRERLTTPGTYTRRMSFARSAGTGTVTALLGTATAFASLRAVEL